MVQIKETYTAGYDVQSIEPLTTHKIVTLCRRLNETFGEGYEFVPEGISEGGIKIIQWPGRNQPGEYKTMRFGRSETCVGKWPWIEETSLQTWRDNPDAVIFHSQLSYSKKQPKLRFGTFLKAFNGAPVWTQDELRLVERCFNEIGFIRVGRMPAKKYLSDVNEKR